MEVLVQANLTMNQRLVRGEGTPDQRVAFSDERTPRGVMFTLL